LVSAELNTRASSHSKVRKTISTSAREDPRVETSEVVAVAVVVNPKVLQEVADSNSSELMRTHSLHSTLFNEQQ
jgi:hypothetical protein